MFDVFISYSSADREWAEVFEERMKQAGIDVFRDKSRLMLGHSYKEQLFNHLKDSRVLVIIWSKSVQSMDGIMKEWIITERETFRANHPKGKIIYLLIDNENPQVDEDSHKLDHLRNKGVISSITDKDWSFVIGKVKEIIFTDRIDIDCYILAVTEKEFGDQLNDENLSDALINLGLSYSDVAKWYGVRREDWRPAGGKSIKEILFSLEKQLANVLKEDSVPEIYKNSKITIKSDLLGLWKSLNSDVQAEINRLSNLDFCWVFIDQLSLYNPKIHEAAHRIETLIATNNWINVFILDPVFNIHNRTILRSKLSLDCSTLYHALTKPQLSKNSTCLGAVDVWHSDDFEKIFRETIRRKRVLIDTDKRSEKRGFASFTTGNEL